MAEDSFAEKEKLLLHKHELEWKNLNDRREMEAARHRSLPFSEMLAVVVGPDPFELETAKLKEKQSRELLALIEERMAASAQREGKLPTLEPPTIQLTRNEFVQRILDEKGWSILDWANEAGVSHVTAGAYLRGKTKTYRSTRVKLAKALGVLVAELPK